jgi:L-aspartate oxidase
MKDEESQLTDFVVVGSGIAGLRGAIELAKCGEVFILCKDEPSESNTEYAQGGIAVALSDEDEVGLHFEDTIKAGDGLCNEEAVRLLVSQGPHYISELIAWGTEFDREGTKLAFTKEAAHSRRRILHAHGDSTGKEIVRALLKKAKTIENIRFLPRSYTIDLITREGKCSGVVYLDEDSGRRFFIYARAVFLATGGCGRVYSETTNPPFATGDGMAIAYRAGAEMMDMEFVQFHPTSLFLPDAPRFLLSEALRGEGGVLRNIE